MSTIVHIWGHGDMTLSELTSELLDIQAVAAQLRCSVKTVRRYEREADGLPYLKVGARHLYRASAVADWLLRREVRRNPRRRGRGEVRDAA